MSIFKLMMTMMLATMLSVPAKTVVSVAEEVHPVLVDNCLIGGLVNGKWVDALAIAPKLKGGEKYRFYTLTARAGLSVGAAPKPDVDYCSDTRIVELLPKPTEGVVLVVGGEWNAMPREPELLGDTTEVYKAVADVLRSKRFVKPRVNITRALRIDLEGDGVKELLISATYYKDGWGNSRPMATRPKAGDYSFVMLRKTLHGRARSFIIDGEFYPRILKDTGPPNQYLVSAVGDVDGDGRMEFIVQADYYEGGGSTVYRVKRDNKLEALSSCGCGA
ncbi:MAG: hypothetical protein QOF02_700 [Blastocatellia bacterium]|nr:hypothetical protein [Blastocatellia bacterium]